MLFNSLDFAIFLPIVFILYWFVTEKSLKLQNTLLLCSSYFFYACWDWRFLFLLIFSTALDYCTGIKIHDSKKKSEKNFWFTLSIFSNLFFLCAFKYYNFFAESFADAISIFGLKANPWTLKIILPIGISFYTFHGLSYIIDIYKDRIKAEKNLIDYSVFVSFFPLLVAGPIERATHLLPQIKNNRVFDYTEAVNGLKQILWGLFKKIVIADQCAKYVNLIFDDSQNYSGSTLVLGAVYFAFQIYGDFSGYSDIASGTAKLFGINLLQNFAFPYFSRDIAEFWRRWHISLSTWFKDYVYVPLGGSKSGTWIKVRNTFAIFILSGFWHGANWTFIFWGLLNALYIMPSIILETNRKHLDIVSQGRYFPTMNEVFAMGTTFSLTTFAWIFFRSENMPQAINYISGIFSTSFFSFPTVVPQYLIFWLLVFLLVEWFGRENSFAIASIGLNRSRLFRYTVYFTVIFTIFYFISDKEQQFIYFQF